MSSPLGVMGHHCTHRCVVKSLSPCSYTCARLLKSNKETDSTAGCKNMSDILKASRRKNLQS